MSNEMMSQIFDPIDLALAAQGSEFSWAVAYLSLAARQGHLCVRQKNETFEPCWEDLGVEIPSRICSDMLKESFEKLQEKAHPYAQKDKDCWYLPRFFHIEKGIAENLDRLNKHLPALKIDFLSLRDEVGDLIERKKLLPLQGESILKLVEHPTVLLTGGPGTGKSYTIRWMIDLLGRHLVHRQFLLDSVQVGQEKMKILVTAPTGKAAANLASSFIKNERVDIRVSTLHRCLRWVPGSPYRQITIDADLIIVDESSMIDAQIFQVFLSSIKPGTRLLLAGDPHQLPAVEAGAVFSDLLDRFPRVHLVECQRAELSSLVKLAEAVYQGNVEEVFQFVDFVKLPQKMTRSFQDKIVNLLEHPQFDEASTPQDLLNHFKKQMLLTPLREGPLGVETLNRLCLERFGSRIIPLLITRNDHKNGLCNGDLGVLVKQGDELCRGDKAYFSDPSQPGGIKEVAAFLLPRYEVAYALTVHKSQGSEYYDVILLLPQGSESFGRQVLYTAITRARRSLVIYGSEEVLKKTLKYAPQRISGLKNLLEPPSGKPLISKSNRV